MKKNLLSLLLLPFLGIGQVVDLASWSLTSNGNITTKQSYVEQGVGSFRSNQNPIAYNASGANITGWNNTDFQHFRYFEVSITPNSGNVIWISNLIFEQASIASGSTPGPSTYIARYYISEGGVVPGNDDFFNNQSHSLVSEESIAANPSISIKINHSLNSNQKLIVRFYTKGTDYNNIKWQIKANTLKFTGYKMNTLSGTYKIGSTSDSDFLTLTSAVNTLNNIGVSGDVTFLLDNSVYSRSLGENFPLIINPYIGNTNYAVTFKPNVGNTVLIEAISPNYNDAYTSVFKLNGVDNVIFDGSNSSDGTTKDLTIYNNNSYNKNKAVIWIASENSTNGSSNNEVKNLVLKQLYTVGNLLLPIGVYSGGTSNILSVAESANSNNTIKNVTFNKVGHAIYVNGKSSSKSSNLKIQDNIIGSTTDSEKPFIGIYLSNVSDYEISGNTIVGVLKRIEPYTTFYSGIQTINTNNGGIFNNILSDIASSAGNGSYGVYLENGNSNIELYNNILSEISSSSGDAYGINIDSGNSNINLYYNTIKMTGNQGSGTTACLHVATVVSNLDIRNNIFVNTQTGSATRYAISTKSDLENIQYNDYYIASGGHIGDYKGAKKTTFSEWIATFSSAATVGSTNINPVFLSNLRLDPSASGNNALVGQPLSITRDIDGDVRALPYMGADEVFVACSYGDETTFGTDSWIGYVYTWYGTPAATDYIGYVTENTNFNRNNGVNQLDGDTRFICGTPPSNNFFVRYKMKTTTAAGTYNITVGSDDGMRLYIDGTLVTGLNRWSDHGYISDAVQYDFTAGEHEFVLEYYENGGASRISFSHGLVQGDASLPYGDNKWNVYGFTKNNFSTVIPDSPSFAGSYVDNNLNVNTTNFWNDLQSPSEATNWSGAPVPYDNFTMSHRRRGFPCGTYQIELANRDDYFQLYIDDILAAEYNVYSNVSELVNSGATFKLDKDSRVEIRLRENSGNAKVTVNFIDVPFVYTDGAMVPANTSIRIDSDVVLTNNIEVCSCYIADDKTLTVNSGKVLTINENISTNSSGKLKIKDGGSLVQTNDLGTYTGTITSFEMERITQPMYRYDFTYWSSPLTLDSNYTLYDLSSSTLFDKYYEYDPATSWIYRTGGNYVMQPGKGYAVRAPQTYSVDPNTKALYTANFIGKPNNGEIKLAVVNVSGNTSTSNLIGNPYPSAIDADQFYEANKAYIKGTFYFWTHNTRVSPTPDANGVYHYSASDYVSYNSTGGTSSGDITDCTTCGGTKPDGNIAAGQAFFVEAKASGDITFNNALRITNEGENSAFYKVSKASKKTSVVEKSRVWLDLKNDKGAYNEMLLGYVTGATNALDDAYDGETYASGNALYSVLGNSNLVIQGRALPFDDTDAVPLGYTADSEKNYSIGINSFDGLFDNQDVFLTDETTNTTINLKNGRYTFSTLKGTFNDRFVLSFKQNSLNIDTPETTAENITIYKKGSDLVVKSAQDNIKSVHVFDMSGRLIYSKNKVDTPELQINAIGKLQQVGIVKVKTTSETLTTKMIL